MLYCYFQSVGRAEVLQCEDRQRRSSWQQAWQLQSMETRAISIRDLIANQTKDQDGVALPATLSYGEISWFTPNPGEGKGRLLQIDRLSQLVAGNTRIARNFSCGQSIVLCGALLNTTSITFPFQSDSSPLFLGAVIPVLCLAFDPNACSGQSYGQGGSGYTYHWQSNNTAIATISGSSTSTTSTYHGAGVGTGSASGFVSSAQCNPSAGGTPKVTPKILMGTSDITNQTQNVIVGQEISLSGQVTGGTITSQAWTIPGTIVAGYTASATSATLTSSVPTNGNSVKFYWVDGADTRMVKYSVTLSDGNTYTASTTFNVKRPSGSMTATAAPSTAIVIGPVQGFTAYEYGTATGGNNGVQFVSSYSIPTGFSGSFEWAQVVTSNTTTRTSSTGVIQSRSCVGSDSYPISLINSANDSPWEAVLSGYKESKRTDSFTIWLMFRPTAGATNIWVPISKVSWGWSADVVSSDAGVTWTFASRVGAGTLSPGLTTTFPTWTSTAQTSPNCFFH